MFIYIFILHINYILFKLFIFIIYFLIISIYYYKYVIFFENINVLLLINENNEFICEKF